MRDGMNRRSWLFAWCVAGLWACSGGGPSGCACNGFTPQPQLTYQGPKLNSAGALRLSARGFSSLNGNASTVLDLFAPGGRLETVVPCSLQSSTLGTFAVADTGSLGCTAESCGRLNGVCDASDLGHTVVITFNGLTFAPKSPDVLEARVTATVQTGPIPISTPNNALLLCLSNQRAKFTVDLDTARAQPPTTDLVINLKLSIDPRWDQLLSLEVASIGNASACSGGASPPNCLDPNDMEILNAGGCSSLQIANLSFIKSLLINQLTDSLKTQISDALADANCAPCGPMGECPTVGMATSACEVDAGVCRDTTTKKCVPALLGVEGRLEVGQALAAVGAPQGAAIELSLGAGGGATANDAGVTLGLRGGARELAVAECVAPAVRATPPTLALPDFDLDAPAPYDVGLSVSNQLVSELLFRAQQSGALCLELGTETVSALESNLLATLLPSLKLLTGGQNVPLRVVIRPVNAPTAAVGEGTVDAMGVPLDPLLTLGWKGLELDVYALLDDRYARLFTVAADLSLPLSLQLDGCSGVTPAVGNLTGAVTNVKVKNAELLAEPLSVLEGLVPALLTLAEPQLAGGLSKFTLPELSGFQLKLVGARGLSRVTGSNTYQHVGLYAELLPATQACTPMMKRAAGLLVFSAVKAGDTASLEARVGERYSWRVDSGLWSTWQVPETTGRLAVQHPRLRLGGAHVIELRTALGERQDVVVR
jgi:hypothetical protein